MKCPNCGQEIQAEHLYCERCGMEIRIVPDFEPEIENSITETLSNVAEEIEDKKEKNQEESEELFPEDTNKSWLTLKLITFGVIVLITIAISVLMYINYSVSFQITNARKFGEQGKYEEALKLLDKASGRDPDNSEIALLKARYYYQLGEADRASEALYGLIERGNLSYDDAENIYTSLISIYDEQQRYDEINELLLKCPEEEITTLFQHYMALAPDYSYESGSYDEVIYLRLSANTTGSIYYTLDGSTPTIASRRYTAPILLESGRYQVNAVFINDYGIESEVVRNWYEINLAIPDAPIVIPESGKYEIPSRIEVLLPEEGTAYYTTDRSDPDIDSIRYTGPIDMPLGRSNFKFVIISKEGVSSEITSRSYEFDMNTGVDIDMAVSNVVSALIQRNVLKDTQGHVDGVAGKYIFRYNSIVEIEKNYYYVLNEYFVDENGNEQQLERLYAVDVHTGSPNRLVYYEDGQMGLISLTD